MSNSGFTFRRVREEMIENLLEMGIKDFRVLDVMAQIPRHIFIDEALRSRAYENRSITIGYQQTISQPYIVAKMTELLISHTGGRGHIFKNILELGSGCGYQSAVLSYFSEEVNAIERIKPLVSKSRENLSELKIFNVVVKHGDGYQDWDPDKKYEGIICAAAPRAFPEELLECSLVNSKIVMPIGNSKEQKLLVVTKTTDGFDEEFYDDVSFVPMLPGKSLDGTN